MDGIPVLKQPGRSDNYISLGKTLGKDFCTVLLSNDNVQQSANKKEENRSCVWEPVSSKPSK